MADYVSLGKDVANISGAYEYLELLLMTVHPLSIHVWVVTTSIIAACIRINFPAAGLV